VALVGRDGGDLAGCRVEGLAAIRELSPSVLDVEIVATEEAGSALQGAADLRVRVDPDGEVDEICEENNEAPLR
jgi:subtilase family serine protease